MLRRKLKINVNQRLRCEVECGKAVRKHEMPPWTACFNSYNLFVTRTGTLVIGSDMHTSLSNCIN